MNRRDTLKALMGIPGLASVQVATLQPTDVIVAECEGQLDREGQEHLREQLLRVWPNHRIVVCDQGLRLRVIKS